MAEKTLSPVHNGEIRNALSKHAQRLREASERAKAAGRPDVAARYWMRSREVEGLTEVFAARNVVTVLTEEM